MPGRRQFQLRDEFHGLAVILPLYVSHFTDNPLLMA
jgi:hypothetical protein